MFDSLKLNLLVGPLAVPMPAPLAVTEAIQRIEVTSSRERSGFQIIFGMGKSSPLELTLLPAGYFDPMITRLVIVATFKGIPTVIMDGVITHQQMQPGERPGQSTLTLTGEDLGILMEQIEVPTPYPGMPELVRINTILAKYSNYAIVPMVIQPPVVNVETMADRFDVQTMSDRTYIKALADQCGYEFYIDPGPIPGQSIAYFGPSIRSPEIQPALRADAGWDRNITKLDFSFNGVDRKNMVAFTFDPATRKIPMMMPVPPVNPARPPLGARALPPMRVAFTHDTAHLTPIELQKRAFGIVASNSDSITGKGSLDVASYGHILRARVLVGVCGAGPAYDGPYYVNNVTHNIKRGEYKQSFELSRDGLVSPTPVVVP